MQQIDEKTKYITSFKISIDDNDYVRNKKKLNSLLNQKNEIESNMRFSKMMTKSQDLDSRYYALARNLEIIGSEIATLENNINKILSSDYIYTYFSPSKYSLNFLSIDIKIKLSETDLDARNKSAETLKDLYSEYPSLTRNLESIRSEIAFLENDTHAILSPDSSIIRSSQFYDSNSISKSQYCDPTFLSRSIKKELLKRMLIFINNLSNEENGENFLFKIFLDCHGLCDKDVTAIADTLKVGRIRAQIDINFSGVEIGKKGGKALIDILESGNRPVWLSISVGPTFYTDSISLDKYTLLSAVKADDVEIVEKLLKNVKRWWYDAEGNSVLHYAIHNGNAEIVNLLLNAHCPFNNRNKKGFTPLDLIAVRGGDIEMARREIKQIYIDNPFYVEILSRTQLLSFSNYIDHCQKYYNQKMELDKFTLIYAQCLFRQYFLVNNEEVFMIANKINWLIEYILYRSKEVTIPEQLAFEIANFYFILSENGNEYYPESIYFLTLSDDYGKNKNNLKAVCYLKLMKQEIFFTNIGNFSLKMLKESVGTEKFLKMIYSSGLIDELKPNENNHFINNELAELYYLLDDCQNLRYCLIRDPNNNQISQMLSQSFPLHAVMGLKQYLGEKKKEKEASIFFYYALPEKRARIYLTLLDDDKKSFQEKSLILLALFSTTGTGDFIGIFSNSETDDFNLQISKVLGFDTSETAREYFLGLIKSELGSIFKEKRETLNKVIEEIVVTGNSNEVIPKEVLNTKFNSLMAMLQLKNDQTILSPKQ